MLSIVSMWAVLLLRASYLVELLPIRMQARWEPHFNHAFCVSVSSSQEVAALLVPLIK